MRGLITVAGLLAATLSLGTPALFPHPGSKGYWMVQVRPQSVESEITISVQDLEFIGDLDSDGDGSLTYEEVSSHSREIISRVGALFRILNEGSQGEVQVGGFQLLLSGDVVLRTTHRFSPRVTRLELETDFYTVTDPTHKVFCRVDYGGEVRQYVFDSLESRQTIDLYQGWEGILQLMARFIRLGVGHIFTGYDHLAFLLGLVLVGRTLGGLIAVVTSFTVAHSITLALSALNVVVLPERFIECAIALSIFYIALENIFVSETGTRWVITFFFGLFHGFGFSQILRGMDLPRANMVASLLSFNAGVELGQVIIMLLLFPLVLFMSRRKWHKSAVVLASALIALLGFYWFLQRVV